MGKLIGVIPAAGKGVRARPYTSLVPKGMLLIAGKPNLERIICLMRDSLQIEEIYIVVGYLGQIVKDYFRDGSALGVKLHYIDNMELDKGLAWSILLAGKEIHSPCCVMLSDECYVGSNHQALLDFPFENHLATCTVMQVDDVELIKRNYSVAIDGSVVSRLIEKPENPQNNLLGCGTFLMNPGLFKKLAGEFERSTDGYVEFVTFLDSVCSSEQGLGCFELQGTYVNINDRDSLNLARYYERGRTFVTKEISLILYSTGVEENIEFAVRKYRCNTKISTLYVILPHENIIEDTLRDLDVRIIKCPPEITLYGEKIKYALERVSGDIFVLAEAGYTFPEHDIHKLLEYMREADMVMGTRTTRQLIAQGSTMCGTARLANVFLAKILEILWWSYEPRFTDVGCTFRAIWRSSYDEVKGRLHAKGPEFLTELVIEILESRSRIIEIPVNYSNKNEALHRRYRNPRTFFTILQTMYVKRFRKNQIMPKVTTKTYEEIYP